MNFVSTQQLERDVTKWADVIPPHRFVAGIEESGMLPALMLAKCWNAVAVPLKLARPLKSDCLVVDDSLNYGGAMRGARELAGDGGCHFAAVYLAEASGAGLVDYYCRIVPRPRFFQWNAFKSDHMVSACIDMDGVICEDCKPEDNDDGPRYAAFLENAKPLHIPRLQAAAIVTGRLEKYRRQTEAWLARNNVPYGRLVMMKFDKPEQRRAYGIARFKAEVYSDPAYRLFVESAEGQAAEIAGMSKKPVLHVPDSGEWRLM